MGCSIRLVVEVGMNAPLKGTPGAAWGSAVSPSITRRKSSVSKELVPFTQLVKVRRGKSVLALPSIGFS